MDNNSANKTVEDNGCSAFADCMFSEFLRVFVPVGAALTAAVPHLVRRVIMRHALAIPMNPQNNSMARYCLMIAALGLLSGLPGSAYAHEDMLAAPQRIEKVYSIPKPVGMLRISYSARSDREPERLSLECELFKAAVPAEGLADLPRPDWEGCRIAYSMTSYDTEKRQFVDRPYIYIKVAVHGPRGETWERTWVHFHFDHDGRLQRKLLRHVPRDGYIRVLSEHWPIGSRASAGEVLKAAEDRDK
jgi:hypothetical protein